jgi:tetratricopeptide (TPR) repeat protein
MVKNRKWVGVIIFLIVAVTIQAQRPRKAFRVGKTSFEKKEYIRAAGWLSIAINAGNSKYNTAYYYRGLSYMLLGDDSKAIDDLVIATQLLPQNADAPLRAARLLYEQEHYNKTLQYATIALDRDEDNFEALKLQALGLVNTGSAESALLTCDRAVAYGEDAELFYAKALASDSLGLFDYAVSYYRQAIETNKQYKLPYHALGKIFVRNGYLNKGIQVFTDAAKRFNDEESYRLRALVYDRMGNSQAQIVDITKILTLNSTRIDLYYRRALLYRKSNLFQNALSDINIYLKWDSLSYDPWILKAELLDDLHMDRKAELAYRNALELTEHPEEQKRIRKAILRINRESYPPEIQIVSPVGPDRNTIAIDAGKSEVTIKGNIRDDSKIISIQVNNRAIDFGILKTGKYVFSCQIQVDSVKSIFVTAVDEYHNKKVKEFNIIKAEKNPPKIILRSPDLKEAQTNTINTLQLTIQGTITEESTLKFVEINQKSIAVKSLGKGVYRFTEQLDIVKQDTVVIVAEDYFGNSIEKRYPVAVSDTISLKRSRLGKTYVVLVVSDSVDNKVLQPVRNHKDSLLQVLDNFLIDSTIVFSGLTKEQLERELLFKMTRLINENRVEALLIYYIGRGKKQERYSYWQMAGKSNDKRTWFNTSILPTVLKSYKSVRFKAIVSEAITPSGNVFTEVDECACPPCEQVSVFPYHGDFIMGIQTTWPDDYRSPILQYMRASVETKKGCFSFVDVINNTKAVFGTISGKKSELFPLILFAK